MPSSFFSGLMGNVVFVGLGISTSQTWGFNTRPSKSQDEFMITAKVFKR
jgi:hypothetical protein